MDAEKRRDLRVTPFSAANSYLSLLSLAASCFFVVRLAHSYPNGAPLVAITGQVGTDRLHIPVVNTMMAKGIIPMDDKYSLWIIGIPQKDYVSQLFDRVDPYSVLFYLFFVIFIFEQVLLLPLFCNKLSKIKSRTLYCHAQFIRP